MTAAHALRWGMGYTSRANGDVPGTHTATYRLSDLVKRGFISPNEGSGLLMDAGLVDLVWQLQWSDRADTPDDALIARLDEAHATPFSFTGGQAITAFGKVSPDCW